MSSGEGSGSNSQYHNYSRSFNLSTGSSLSNESDMFKRKKGGGETKGNVKQYPRPLSHPDEGHVKAFTRDAQIQSIASVSISTLLSKLNIFLHCSFAAVS